MVIIIVGCIAAVLAVPLALCCLALKKVNYDLEHLYGDF